METVVFKIRRFNPAEGGSSFCQKFEVKTWEKMSVLEGLFYIQDELDGSLAFRYSCRGAVCGSCAMVINGKIMLACRTQVRNLRRREVVIEPLPGLKVIKDLVVDMEPFWKSYRAIKPWLVGKDPPPERENRMSEESRRSIDQYLNCILCASCYGACPVVWMDRAKKVYLGPATLAKAYRFLADPRNTRGAEILDELDSIAGVWGCHQALRCTLYCPKDVRPSDGIMALRRAILKRKLGITKRVPGVVLDPGM